LFANDPAVDYVIMAKNTWIVVERKIKRLRKTAPPKIDFIANADPSGVNVYESIRQLQRAIENADRNEGHKNE
jgi:hypothetical protein